LFNKNRKIIKVVFLIIIASVNPSEKDALNYYLQEMIVLYQEVGAKPRNYS